MVIYALVIEIFKIVMKSWPHMTFMGHVGTLAFVAPYFINKKILKIIFATSLL